MNAKGSTILHIRPTIIAVAVVVGTGEGLAIDRGNPKIACGRVKDHIKVLGRRPNLDGPVKLAIVVVGEGDVEVVIGVLDAVPGKVDGKQFPRGLVRSMEPVTLQPVQEDPLIQVVKILDEFFVLLYSAVDTTSSKD